MDKDHPNLYKSVIKGSFWVFALRISTQMLSMLRLVILARLLAPEDFGLLGIALLLMSILQTFTEAGMDAALIQKQKDITPYLDTAWTLKVFRGFALYALLFFAAPLAAGLKMSPEQIETAVLIIRVTGLSLIIDGFVNIGTIYFAKELKFDKSFTMGTVSNLCSMLISIAIAIVYKNPWALVAGKLINSLSGTILSYYLHPYRPRFSYSHQKAAELWRFGRWITFSSAIVFLENYADDFFVLFVFGTEALAIYQMAYKIALFPVDFGANILSQITFPAFSKVSNDIYRLKKAYLKTYRFASNLAIPTAVSICILAPALIPIFMGEKWLSTVLLVQILSVKGLFQALGITRGPLFMSLNKHHLATKFQFIRAIVLIVLVYPFSVYWQLSGVCIAVVTACLAPIIPAYALANRLINANKMDIFKESRQAILLSILAAFLSFLLMYAMAFLKVSI